MSTNYYLRKDNCIVCEECGHSNGEYHIGKSSGGWYFALHIDPHLNINNLYDLIKKMNNSEYKIYNEYGAELTIFNMLNIIMNRDNQGILDLEKPPYTYTSWEEFFNKNNAEKGINGLLRPKNCKHENGTWYLSEGEFC